MNDSPLPVFTRGSTPGRRSSSCSGACGRTTSAGAGAVGEGSALPITHGTTVVAIRYADGVVMAGDRRATSGFAIASRRIEKVFAADEHSGVAFAGAAGPASRW